MMGHFDKQNKQKMKKNVYVQKAFENKVKHIRMKANNKILDENIQFIVFAF